MHFSNLYSFSNSLFGIGLLALLLSSCTREKGIAPVAVAYEFAAPAEFPDPIYTFKNNPITKEGFLLGKRLFFDPILSADHTISCASCHIQSLAFADVPLHGVSVGVNGLSGTRNAPALANLAFKPEFFWDGGVTHLDFAPLNAIESEFEMGSCIEDVIEKLNAHPQYPSLFRQAFTTEKVTTPYLLYALAQFMNRMISDQSPYDQYLAGTAKLSEPEIRGMDLFQQHCASCHDGILFTDYSYRNNGLDSLAIDPGRARISAFAGDHGKFQVPSLRNVGVTAPYMHDARFRTLEAVLDHYSEGVVASPTLDMSLQRGDQLGIQLTDSEKAAIIAFLHTLTDRDFLNDPLFRRE
ncbi:cytochrome-c peroxidase [Flavilitoribacter nigricans]|uniref:Cytochrome-c peroxidase n=1 Tax=Flavilitoribacter nigricans (strain ATCC 23147 / DSM 23189 / NBRC 102662 / NCIMB 1420 / SS-2) TaxID=1122177 RepID=A0A2D0N2U6_FLAN2|nr:cytochrome c peroxidase [Flavilitoribacter nigricans]PHN02706.1 cytochrome-c peroxidase [Flavilitoribacter nigricans DSM 23189 = NBRC 102662]